MSEMGTENDSTDKKMDMLSILRSFDAIRDQDSDDDKNDQIKKHVTNNIAPEFSNEQMGDLLNPAVVKCVNESGIDQLYKHQIEAIKYALKGHNVVLESPTASGKTLSFSLPMLDFLTDDRSAHALLIYPMKALANDQRRQLEDLKIKDKLKIESWLIDGDTDKEYRKLLKDKPPPILITNPDFLHASFLGWNEQWGKLYNNLRYIVVDEIHEYRGYFGTNFSLVMKRFLLMLRKRGIEPQLFLSTATCANPQEHAERLTGKDFQLVTAKDSIAPKRNYIFINPKIPDYQYYNIFRLRIINAGLACLSQGLSTLVFCPSRQFAEACNKEASKKAEEKGLDKEAIVPYRSGYKSEERRKIEAGLRDGHYQLIFSTNALELGIDIGKLDVVILAGFPDSIMSAWQRIGRAGRNWKKEVHIIFYALNNAVDRFYVDNINAFIDKPLDEIVISKDNEEIFGKHLPYLLHEIEGNTLDGGDQAILGQTFSDKVNKTIKTSRPTGLKPYYPALSIRGNSTTTYTLKHGNNEIGTISGTHFFKEAYIGAIYQHINNYKVISHGANEIQLETAEPYLISEPSFWTTIQDGQVYDGFSFCEKIRVFYGDITIQENFNGYKIIDQRTREVIDQRPANHLQSLKAHAFWFIVEDNQALLEEGALRAIENMFRVGAIFIIPSDRHDTSTFCQPKENKFYFYENYSGGIGIAEKALSVWQKVFEKGLDIASQCSCKKGCPSCIMPPKFKSDMPFDKQAGIQYIEEMIAEIKNGASERYNKDINAWETKPVKEDE